MRKENIIILVGILIFLTPFLGVPGSVKTLLTAFFGIVIVILGIMVRSDFKRFAVAKGKQTDAFVENGTAEVHHDEKA
jgi:hypothetical protein